MAAKSIRKKKTNETVKEGLLNSVRENNAVEKLRLNIDKVTDQVEAITIINSYDEIIKTQSNKNDRICCETRTDTEEVSRYRIFCLKSGTKQIKYII